MTATLAVAYLAVGLYVLSLIVLFERGLKVNWQWLVAGPIIVAIWPVLVAAYVKEATEKAWRIRR